MPQMTVASIFSRLDHAGPNSFLPRTVIQMLHEATPTRSRVRTLCHGQPFLCRQPDGSTTWRDCIALHHAAPDIITHTCSALHPHQARPHRIQVYVVHERAIVITRAALAQDRLVTITEQPSPQSMPAIMPPSIGVLQPSHSRHQVSFGRFHHQMVMIAHQDPRMHPPAGPFTRLTQGLVK